MAKKTAKSHKPAAAKKASKPAPKKAAPKAKSAPAKKGSKTKAPKAAKVPQVEIVEDEALLDAFDASADAYFLETFGQEVPVLEREMEDGRVLVSELAWVHAYVTK